MTFGSPRPGRTVALSVEAEHHYGEPWGDLHAPHDLGDLKHAATSAGRLAAALFRLPGRLLSAARLLIQT